LAPDDIVASVPVQVVSTGVPFLLVPVNSMDALRKARMERQRLKTLLTAAGVDAAYLFCLGGVEAHTELHGRLFSPSGTLEDPFTGSAVGCAAAFAVEYGLHPGPELTVEQGHLMGRPGSGIAIVTGSAGNLQQVKIGGSAVRTLDGFIYV
jgi:trans-2,3-dihydro-3-hydroxyanthranilate isomerase